MGTPVGVIFPLLASYANEKSLSLMNARVFEFSTAIPSTFFGISGTDELRNMTDLYGDSATMFESVGLRLSMDGVVVRLS